MTGRLVNLIMKKAILKENRLLLTFGFALGTVLIVTFFKVYGSVLFLGVWDAQLLWLTNLSVTAVFIMLFSFCLFFPFKSFEFSSAVFRTRIPKEPQKPQNLTDDGPLNEAEELNMYQGAAPELTGIVDVQGKRLSILSDFITSSAEVYDPKEFILSFIETIKKVLDIELAAYLWHKEGGVLEGNIIASPGLDESVLESVQTLLIKRTEGHVGSLSLDASLRLGVINRDMAQGITQCKSIDPEKLFNIELPLKCSGTTIGVLVLFFDMEKVRDFDFTLFDPIVDYVCVVFDRLLTLTSMKGDMENGGLLISPNDSAHYKDIQSTSNKPAALGEIVAGIADEVNNPLQVMIGNVDILEQRLKEDDLGVEKIKEIKDGIFKIKSSVNNMLDFARGESMETENAAVNVVQEQQRKDPDLSLLLNKRVLMVEDEDRIVDVVRPIISPMVAVFDTFTSISDAQELLSSNEYDIILLDIGLPVAGSMELYVWINSQVPHLKDKIIFLCAEVDSEKMRGFLSLTGVPAIKKPFRTKELLSVITTRLEEEVLK